MTSLQNALLMLLSCFINHEPKNSSLKNLCFFMLLLIVSTMWVTDSHFFNPVFIFPKFQDRNQPEVTDRYFHDVPFDAHFASELSDFHSVSSMPGVDGFTMKVDALYKVPDMRYTVPQGEFFI